MSSDVFEYVVVFNKTKCFCQNFPYAEAKRRTIYMRRSPLLHLSALSHTGPSSSAFWLFGSKVPALRQLWRLDISVTRFQGSKILAL
ncbi:unnamed protein product [Rhizophagus irregularis]|nr:unnamed protein product [Rhizophagus irregularis]